MSVNRFCSADVGLVFADSGQLLVEWLAPPHLKQRFLNLSNTEGGAFAIMLSGSRSPRRGRVGREALVSLLGLRVGAADVPPGPKAAIERLK